MAEQREFLVRDPNAVGAQQSLTALALVKDFYAQDTDPGAVGAGSVWRDTSNLINPGYNVYAHYQRSVDNLSWEPAAGFYAQAAVGVAASARLHASTSGAAGATLAIRAENTTLGIGVGILAEAGETVASLYVTTPADSNGVAGQALVSDAAGTEWGGIRVAAGAPVDPPSGFLPLAIDTSDSNALYVWDGAAWLGPYVVTP